MRGFVRPPIPDSHTTPSVPDIHTLAHGAGALRAVPCVHYGHPSFVLNAIRYPYTPTHASVFRLRTQSIRTRPAPTSSIPIHLPSPCLSLPVHKTCECVHTRPRRPHPLPLRNSMRQSPGCNTHWPAGERGVDRFRAAARGCTRRRKDRGPSSMSRFIYSSACCLAIGPRSHHKCLFVESLLRTLIYSPTRATVCMCSTEQFFAPCPSLFPLLSALYVSSVSTVLCTIARSPHLRCLICMLLNSFAPLCSGRLMSSLDAIFAQSLSAIGC